MVVRVSGASESGCVRLQFGPMAEGGRGACVVSRVSVVETEAGSAARQGRESRDHVRTAFAGSDDRTVRLWSSTGQAIATLEGHTRSVYTVAWSADGTTLASGVLFLLCLRIVRARSVCV